MDVVTVWSLCCCRWESIPRLLLQCSRVCRTNQPGLLTLRFLLYIDVKKLSALTRTSSLKASCVSQTPKGALCVRTRRKGSEIASLFADRVLFRGREEKRVGKNDRLREWILYQLVSRTQIHRPNEQPTSILSANWKTELARLGFTTGRAAAKENGFTLTLAVTICSLYL